MGAILHDESVDERMAALTEALAHNGTPDPSRQRRCARCGEGRGRGHRWCVACRRDVKKEYNDTYYRTTYRPKRPAEVSAARRLALGKRWNRDV